MKKTLFLSAILGAALCSTTMGAVTQWDISAWNNYNQASSSVTVSGRNVIDINFAPSTWNDLHGSFVVSVQGDSLQNVITLMALSNGDNVSFEGMSLATSEGQTQLVTNTWTNNKGTNVDLDALKGKENLTFVLTRENNGQMSTSVYDSSDFSQAIATVTHGTAQTFRGWQFNGLTIGGTEPANSSNAAANTNAQSFTITKAGYSTSAVVTSDDLTTYYAANGPVTKTWTGAQGNVWDANTTNWTTEEGSATFSAEDNVIFGSEATNKNVAVHSNLSVTRVTVNDDYTLAIDDGKGIYSRILSVADGKVLTINGGTLDTFSVSGSGKISGNGTVRMNKTALGDVTINAENFTGTYIFNQTFWGNHDSHIVADDGFKGTLEIRGRISTSGTSFGNAQKIRFVGDRTDNYTGIWANSATSISKNIEITGGNAVQFELSNSLTLSGALSGSGTLMITNNGGPLNITGGGTLGTLWVKGKTEAVANISGNTLNLTKFYTGGRTTNINTTVNAGQLRLSENGSNGVVSVNAGGTLNISGSNNDLSTDASILLAHWNQASTLRLNGGTINAEDAEVHLSWTGTGTFEALSGTAKVKGINGEAQNWGGRAFKGFIKLGTEDSGKATVVVGASGLTNIGGSVVLDLGNGTLGASADWELSKGGASTESKANFIGTTEDGTIINTTDANDASVARTITFTNGTKGAGNLTVAGIGKLILNGDGSERTGKTTVKGGTLGIGNSNALGSGAVAVEDGAVLDATGVYLVINAAGNWNGLKALNDQTTTSGTGYINLGSGEITMQTESVITFGNAYKSSGITFNGQNYQDTITSQTMTVGESGSLTVTNDAHNAVLSLVSGAIMNIQGGAVTADSLNLGHENGHSNDGKNTQYFAQIALSEGSLTTGAITLSTSIGNALKMTGGTLTVTGEKLFASDTTGALETLSLTGGTLAATDNSWTINRAGTIGGVTISTGADKSITIGANVTLSGAITNNGNLVFADGISATAADGTFTVKSNAGSLTHGTSGFMVTKDDYISVVTNGSGSTLTSNNVTVTQGDKTFTLGNNGEAHGEKQVNYTTYKLNGSDSASVSDMKAESSDMVTTVVMSGTGALSVDAAITNVTVSHTGATAHMAGGSITNLTMAENAALAIDSETKVALSTLTLGSGASVTVNDHAGTIELTTLVVEGNSDINADLVVKPKGIISFAKDAVLTMGCGVEIGEGVTVVIDAELVPFIQSGTAVTIIDGIDTDPTLTLGSDWKFVGTYGEDLNGYGLALQAVDNGDSTWRVVVTPEPATATLSLLALAALAARRKRH